MLKFKMGKMLTYSKKRENMRRLLTKNHDDRMTKNREIHFHNFEENWLKLTHEQCDQMARLFAHFLVIYKNENVPNGIHNLLK